jgi:hypothetical protein
LFLLPLDSPLDTARNYFLQWDAIAFEHFVKLMKPSSASSAQTRLALLVLVQIVFKTLQFETFACEMVVPASSSGTRGDERFERV